MRQFLKITTLKKILYQITDIHLKLIGYFMSIILQLNKQINILILKKDLKSCSMKMMFSKHQKYMSKITYAKQVTRLEQLCFRRPAKAANFSLQNALVRKHKEQEATSLSFHYSHLQV